MEQLNRNQLSSDGSTPPPETGWQIGMECIALRDDRRWYRAKIIDIKDNLYVVSRVTLLSLSMFLELSTGSRILIMASFWHSDVVVRSWTNDSEVTGLIPTRTASE